VNDVTRLYTLGGSFLRTSRQTLNDAQEVDNVLRVLEHLRVRYLVCIGGSVTAYSASLVASAAKATKFKLSIVHVPKTIFNDLPLPENTKTFGFDTAREVGVKIVHNLKADARTMGRWYVIVVMGQQAGHLSLGIGKAAAATLTLIPEEFKARGEKVIFGELCDLIEAAMTKRRAMNREYGVCVVTEGLVDLMDEKEVTELFGNLDGGHQELGRHIVVELNNRFKSRGIDMTVVSRNVGNELRAADPNATDSDLARDLGYGATKFLLQGGSNCMVSLSNNTIHAIPLTDLLDPQTGTTQIRCVDIKSLSYEVAKKYMIRLTPEDLADVGFAQKMAAASGLSVEELRKRFKKVADWERTESSS